MAGTRHKLLLAIVDKKRYVFLVFLFLVLEVLSSEWLRGECEGGLYRPARVLQQAEAGASRHQEFEPDRHQGDPEIAQGFPCCCDVLYYFLYFLVHVEAFRN